MCYNYFNKFQIYMKAAKVLTNSNNKMKFNSDF